MGGIGQELILELVYLFQTFGELTLLLEFFFPERQFFSLLAGTPAVEAV